MAKRKFNQKARALEPAVMKLHFVAQPNQVNAVVDLSECVSRLNRRFYRQGLNWAVSNVKVTTQPATSAVNGAASYVNTIPHTWCVASSWVKSFHAWKDQQDASIEIMGGESAVARFRDFKVSMAGDYATATKLSPVSVGPGNIVGPFLAGLISGPVVVPSAEWTYSQIVIPNDGAPDVTNEYYLHMVGDSTAGSKGIIHGYEQSRSFPQSPDPASPQISTSWLNRMHDRGGDSDDIVDNAELNNDKLPYDQNEYPGGKTNFVQLECQGYKLNQSTVGLNSWNTGPFTAPCGLIRFDFMDQTPVGGGVNDANFIEITLVPGSHRGYLCETMEEF